ncbi:MAG: DUF1565 domain-containing protein [Oscillatoria sp. SIO1A7]|nr:DUF1565 domain-containing protein [Oscillatoria sp. SIO1A7]
MMILSSRLSACLFGAGAALVTSVGAISPFALNALALSQREVDAIAWQVSVLISPNLTKRGDRLIIQGEKTGSGVILARNGNTYYVLTALHVVLKRGGFHAIATPDGRVHYVDASSNSSAIIPLGSLAGNLGQQINGLDLALLKFESDRSYPVARIASERVRKNESVFVSGWRNPSDLRRTTRFRRLTPGSIREIVNSDSTDGGYSLLYSNETGAGTSGGPIFNASGQLIGIHGRGRGIENNCSSIPELNVNNSCGMQLIDFLNHPQVRAARLEFNRNPPDREMIRYGLTHRSQSDRIGGINSPNPTPSPPQANLPPENLPPENLPPENLPPENLPPEPSPDSEEGNIYYVDPQRGTNKATAGSRDNPFRSITYALQGIRQGTTIQLAPGTYNQEKFPIKLKPGIILKGDSDRQGRGVTILGGGFLVTRTSGNYNTAILAAKNSSIIGLTVTNNNQGGTGIVVDGTNPTIGNNTFANNGRDGIVVAGDGSPRIDNNLFLNNRGNGIAVIGSASGDIRNNDFQNTGLGLAIGETAAPVVADNHIRANKTGIAIGQQSRPTLQGNIIENNQEYGLLVMAEARAEVTGNNLFRNNTTSDRLIARTKTWPVNPRAESGQTPIFGCIEYDGGIATFAQNGNSSIPRPMLTWNNSRSLPPKNRCDLATQRLRGIVDNFVRNNGRLEQMFLSSGRVNDSPAICLLEDEAERCNNSNMLFLLSPEQQNNPLEALEQLLIFEGATVSPAGSEVRASLKPLAQSLQPELGLWFAD